jgi:hypothetical protein
MVDTAKRDRELVAHLAPERWMLGKPEVVRLSRPAATDQARLFADELDMSFVADPARLGPRQGALIDCCRFRAGPWSTIHIADWWRISWRRFVDLGLSFFSGPALEGCHSGLECLFHHLSVGFGERVFHPDDPVGPGDGLIGAQSCYFAEKLVPNPCGFLRRQNGFGPSRSIAAPPSRGGYDERLSTPVRLTGMACCSC